MFPMLRATTRGFYSGNIMPRFRPTRKQSAMFANKQLKALPAHPFATGRKGISSQDYEKALQECQSDGLYEVTPNALALDGLALWLEKGKLNLAPGYQRGWVWGHDKASRLVVTVLCGRIVPAVTVCEIKNGVFDVVDGKQRLTTLLSFFLAGSNPDLHKKMVDNAVIPTNFTTLSGLDENYDSMDGLTFAMLSDERQKAFENFKIPITTIPRNTNEDDVFSCYEDINSGGEDLTAQQLRRAAFWKRSSRYIQLLDDLAKNKDFQRIYDPNRFKNQTYKPCAKDMDRELILRGFAWERSGKHFKGRVKFFLNHELVHFRNLTERKQDELLKNRKAEFELIMKVWATTFSENDGAFRAWKRHDGEWTLGNQVSKPLWDLMYPALADLVRVYPKHHMYTKCKKELQEATKSLFTEKGLLLTGKSAKNFLERKALILGVLTEVMSKANPEQGPRTFPDKENMINRLFGKQKGRCSICGQSLDENRIHDGSYASIDHVDPFSNGGRSSEENAALAHVECNRSKGAKTGED